MNERYKATKQAISSLVYQEELLVMIVILGFLYFIAMSLTGIPMLFSPIKIFNVPGLLILIIAAASWIVPVMRFTMRGRVKTKQIMNGTYKFKASEKKEIMEMLEKDLENHSQSIEEIKLVLHQIESNKTS